MSTLPSLNNTTHTACSTSAQNRGSLHWYMHAKSRRCPYSQHAPYVARRPSNLCASMKHKTAAQQLTPSVQYCAAWQGKGITNCDCCLLPVSTGPHPTDALSDCLCLELCPPHHNPPCSAEGWSAFACFAKHAAAVMHQCRAWERSRCTKFSVWL